MYDVMDTLHDLSEKATHQSIRHSGIAEGLNVAAVLIHQHLTDQKPQPAPQATEAALPTPTPEKGQSKPAPKSAKKAKSAEIMAPAFDLLRERATWMSEPEIAEALGKNGWVVSHEVVWRALNAGVRAGHLERSGNSFRTGPLKK